MIKDALKQFITYTAGTVIRTALNFILLPLYLRSFEPSDYGVISLLGVLSSLISLLVGTGFISGLFRLYYEAGTDEKKSLTSATWLWYFLTSLVPSMALFIASTFFSNLLFQKADFSYAIKLLSISFILSMMENIPYNFLRLEKRPGYYVFFSLISFISSFLLKFYFIAILSRGIDGYFESNIIGSIFILCVMTPFIIKYVGLHPKISHFKELLSLGYPFIFSGIAVWTLDKANRFVLNYNQGTESVGVYSLGCNFSGLFSTLLTHPSSLFWNPFFFSHAAKMSEQDVKKLLNRSMIYFFLLGCILALSISLVCGDMLRIFTSKTGYWQAEILVPILIFGDIIYLLCRQGGCALLLVNRPQITSVAGIAAAVVNLGANFLLVPIIGVFGAAFSTVIAYILYFILIYWKAQALFHVDYDWKGLAKGSLFFIITLVLSWQIKIDQPWISLFVRFFVGVSIFSLLIWFFGNIITQDERHIIKSYYKNFRKYGIKKSLHNFLSKTQ